MEDNFKKFEGEVVEEEKFWQPKTRLGKWMDEKNLIGPTIELVGGICVLAAAILGLTEGNSFVNVVTTDNQVYKVRAKKQKTAKNLAKEVNHVAADVEVQD